MLSGAIFINFKKENTMYKINNNKQEKGVGHEN
jgi:hypothetical protein